MKTWGKLSSPRRWQSRAWAWPVQGCEIHCAGGGPAAAYQAAYRRLEISWAPDAWVPLHLYPAERGSCNADTPKVLSMVIPWRKAAIKLGRGGKECDGKSKGAAGNTEDSASKARPPTSRSSTCTSCQEDNLVPAEPGRYGCRGCLQAPSSTKLAAWSKRFLIRLRCNSARPRCLLGRNHLRQVALKAGVTLCYGFLSKAGMPS